MTDQEQEPWQEPWPEKMYLLHPSIKTFGAMVSNPERREYVRADRIEELVEERDTARRLLGAATQMQIETQAKLTKAVGVIKALLERDERNTCQHENTERCGFLWEICLDCGYKWADDEGGKPMWKDPQAWVDASAVLAELEGGE